jgi:tyrosyl-DNA phosphodiesterase 2
LPQLSKLPLENYARWNFSTMPAGRVYLEADITPGSTSMKPIRIATTQLECPIPPSSMHFRERHTQTKHAVAALSSAENVVFGGDMSWDDNTDLPFPLPAGWVDAWTLMKPHEVGTGSSSTRSGDWIEPFRAGGLCNAPRKRSDRFACKLRDYELRIVTYRA